ncbi:two pore domain potassium channel family protein [Amycolatopsis sp. K13G38]|uniref:Two pore domain potassium channel family protein n=1 Tax=Amycolatopsis acididurans TaxID=2724524 RepID=A0ABX1IXT8_9PSEU|nr:potassium channel family protein [Amycolatopsis acididurans]NKQ52323.1 two pore domain potassium channel family protein [Amycolatopsis acididurans]
MTSGPSQELRPRRRRVRFLLLGVVRPLLTVALLVAAYYVLPVGQRLDGGGMALLIGGLALVALLVVWEVRNILRSTYPLLQGVQALALVVPLFLLVFADVYHVLAVTQPGSFTAVLTKTDALYFVVTVFATVGFGDIAAVTATARILVTLQMVGDLIVVGLVLRVIVTAVQRRRDQGRS